MNAPEDDFDYSDMLWVDEGLDMVGVGGTALLQVHNGLRVQKTPASTYVSAARFTDHNVGDSGISIDLEGSPTFPTIVLGTRILSTHPMRTQAPTNAGAYVDFSGTGSSRIVEVGADTFRRRTASTNYTIWDALTLPYEEGTFTPALQAATSNPTVTHGTRAGRYTRIGRMVFFNINLATTAVSGGSGRVRISGLPFTSLSTESNAIVTVRTANILWTNTPNAKAPFAYIPASADYVDLYLQVHDAATEDLPIGNWAATGSVRLSGAYMI